MVNYQRRRERDERQRSWHEEYARLGLWSRQVKEGLGLSDSTFRRYERDGKESSMFALAVLGLAVKLGKFVPPKR